MKRKVKGVVLVMTICFIVILLGFIVVSNRLPKFVKDRSSFKINCSMTPFDFRVDMNGYSLYINEKVITNLRSSSEKIFDNTEKILRGSTSRAVDEASQVFKNMEDRINGLMESRVK